MIKIDCPECDGTGEGTCASCGDRTEECCCDEPEHTECSMCEGSGEVEVDE